MSREVLKSCKAQTRPIFPNILSHRKAENQVDRVGGTPLIKKTAQKRKIFMKYH
ncbi:hypothetical protein [Hominenteromicrobium sp.]|uniref:hypothetical protein n=1 Tax=Hominenteromicrobium sp. TaxID=3073581 RepID=UPI003A92FD90|nr:hypothetical protein [Bacillota bacterium]